MIPVETTTSATPANGATRQFERPNGRAGTAGFRQDETARPTTRLASALKGAAERLSRRLADRYIPRLNRRRDRVRNALHAIPDRMQMVTNQARLVLELIDDFGEGRYRGVPWHTIAVAAAALLYSVSPGDVLPDVIPVIGAFDDVVVIALAMRIIQRDLEKYCRHKGYDRADYFTEPSRPSQQTSATTGR
jgi:uncharacterized membrane protein YkvA (DUF1232 family)